MSTARIINLFSSQHNDLKNCAVVLVIELHNGFPDTCHPYEKASCHSFGPETAKKAEIFFVVGEN